MLFTEKCGDVKIRRGDKVWKLIDITETERQVKRNSSSVLGYVSSVTSTCHVHHLRRIFPEVWRVIIFFSMPLRETSRPRLEQGKQYVPLLVASSSLPNQFVWREVRLVSQLEHEIYANKNLGFYGCFSHLKKNGTFSNAGFPTSHVACTRLTPIIDVLFPFQENFRNIQNLGKIKGSSRNS